MNTAGPALVVREARADVSTPRRLGPSLALAGGVMAVALALHLRDPHEAGSWGFCPWLLLTGTQCPLCGGLRAVNDLTFGRFSDAVSSNALVVAALPVVALAWLVDLTQRARGVTWRLSNQGWRLVAWGLIAALMVFWVVRNLAFAAALRP